MSNEEKIEHLLLVRSLIKGLVENTESVLGVQAAFPITLRLAEALDQVDVVVGRLTV